MPTQSELHEWHSLEAMTCRSKEQDKELDVLRQRLKAQGYDGESQPKARVNAPHARINATGYFARGEGWSCDFRVIRDTGDKPQGIAVARFQGQIKSSYQLSVFNSLMAQALEDATGEKGL